MTDEPAQADHAKIVTAWALGLTPATIASQLGYTLDDVDQALAEHRERRAAAPVPDSLELKRDALDALDAQMERLSLMASQTATGPAARVAAMRTWREMWSERLELLRELGYVEAPAGPGLYHFGALLRAVLEALRAEQVPQEVLDRVAARVLSGNAGDLENVVAIEARPR